MSKHTPGPWKAHFEDAYFVTGPDLGRVAMMMNLKGAHGLGGRRSGNESAANARLIAAAPDLLEALQSVAMWAENQADGQSKGGHATFDLMMLREQRDIARAAIAKATGEQA